MSWLDEIGKDTPLVTEDYINVLGTSHSEYNRSQETEEKADWYRQRLGMTTGSTFGKLVVKSRDKKSYQLSSSQMAEKLIYRIAWERLLKEGNISHGLGRLNISSKEMEHSNDYEGEAILKYQRQTNLKVNSTQSFIKQDAFIGGTPDGFIGNDGLIEVKCPYNGANHLKSLLTGEIYNSDYMYQIQGYLWITDRKWCDFVTYDPDLVKGLQLNIIRVERDESIIKGISEVMILVKDRINEIMSNEKLNIKS